MRSDQGLLAGVKQTRKAVTAFELLRNLARGCGHSRTPEKCRKNSPAASVSYISLVFSNALRVLSQCNTRLGLLSVK